MSFECLLSGGEGTLRKTVLSLLEDGDLLLVQDGNHGGNYPAQSDFVEIGGIPLITGADIERGVIDIKGSKRITLDKASRLRVGIAKAGDLLLTHKGTMGKTAIVPSIDTPFIVVNPQVTIYRSNPLGSIDTKFLKYFFDSPEFQEYLIRISSTSTISTLSISNQKGLEIPCPPIEVQNNISKVLGTLDEKIELNRKTNETLEGIAKALFESWFVDFDPVRAKAEGRPTGLPDEISDLFPDSFEESELGEIPSGWAISSVKDQSSYLSRGISPKYCEDGGGVVVLNQKCIRGGAVDFLKSRRHDPSKKKIEGRQISKFDCLINSTGVGTLGRVAIVPGLAFGDVIVDSHVTTVRGHDEQSTFYLTNALLNRQSEIEALGEGSTGQTELSRVVLGEMELVVPPKALLNVFYSSIVCIFEKRWANEATSTTLASLRDALLPKLISGELRVPDAEKMLEEVGI